VVSFSSLWPFRPPTSGVESDSWYFSNPLVGRTALLGVSSWGSDSPFSCRGEGSVLPPSGCSWMSQWLPDVSTWGEVLVPMVPPMIPVVGNLWLFPGLLVWVRATVTVQGLVVRIVPFFPLSLDAFLSCGLGLRLSWLASFPVVLREVFWSCRGAPCARKGVRAGSGFRLASAWRVGVMPSSSSLSAV